MKSFYIVRSIVFFSLVSFAVVAQNFDTQKIFDQSPAGRYFRKEFSEGVKNFRLDRGCVISDLESVFKMQNPPMKVQIPLERAVFRDEINNLRTRDLTIEIRTFEEELQKQTSKMLDLFKDAADPVTAKREICLISGVFDSPNAVSIAYGFMVFDPRLFFQIIRSASSNSWSLRALIAHELAHQLQFWHQDPTLTRMKSGQLSARDKELQADCIAAGILSRIYTDNPWDRLKEDAEVDFKTALQNAFASLGDFELKSLGSHHGTAWERLVMVESGIDAATKLSVAKQNDSASLLKTCRMDIDRMNLKFGHDLWPTGSRPK